MTEEFIDDKERELLARARLGADVMAFLRSDVGRYLHGRAKMDAEAAKEDLTECNVLTPWGRRKYRLAKQRLEIARNFMRYCADVIQDGDVAMHEIEER